MRKLALGIILVAIFGGALAFWWQSARRPEAAKVREMPTEADVSAIPPSAVLRVRPGASEAPAAVKAAPPLTWSPVVSAELTQFRSRRDYNGLYQSLKAQGNSPEALYLRAEIYSICARKGNKDAITIAKERADRVAKYSETNTAPERVAAYEKLNDDPCNGLDLGVFDKQELARLVSAAAAAGDPRALAWELAERVERPYFDALRGGEQRAGYDLSREDFENARQLLGSRDPTIIQDLQGVLSSTLEHGSIRIGDQVVDPAAMHAALGLVACDVGAQCGPNSPELLANCAYRGQCLAGSQSEYTYYYGAAPAQAQLIENYRQSLLQMINARDFSNLTFVPGVATPGSTSVFGGRRGGGPGG